MYLFVCVCLCVCKCDCVFVSECVLSCFRALILACVNMRVCVCV